MARTWYLPFGGYRPGSAPTQTGNGRDFTDQRENMELGLLYYNARFYAPGLGRFASADSIIPDPTNPQSLNRYSYGYNNPVKYQDPTGHAPTRGCEYEGCDLDENLNPDETWITAQGQVSLIDPVLAAQYPGELTWEEVVFSVGGMAGVSALPTAIEYGVGQAAWPALVKAGGTIASWLCLRDGDCTNEASAATRTLGQLRQVAQGVWESTAGLRYGQDFIYGNRVQHVLRHAVNDSTRAIHSVFSGGRTQVLPVIDEAWQSVQQGVNVTSVAFQGDRTVYIINMGRTVGYVGGQTGAATGYPTTSYIQLVVQGANELITAFPVIPPGP
jgi:RHS repeat-associated protein